MALSGISRPGYSRCCKLVASCEQQRYKLGHGLVISRGLAPHVAPTGASQLSQFSTSRCASSSRAPASTSPGAPQDASMKAAPLATGSNQFPHVPVMLHGVLEAFQPVTMHVYLDCTLGAGGHASEIVAAHPELRTCLGIDLDPTAHRLAEPCIRMAAAGRDGFMLRLLRGNYRDLKALLAAVSNPAPRSNGILMDLGVSSMQLDTAERGFSFMRDGPLDMRMDPGAALSAEELLNTWSEVELGRIIRDYGEEKLWKVVARRIVQAREVEPIRTTQQLVRAVGNTQLGGKGGRSGKGAVHPATRTFQALRIAVNDELQKLEQALPDAISALAPGGRLAVISFHSLEDRIVKYAFLRAAGRPTPEDEHLTYGPDKYEYLDRLYASRVAEIVTRKPILPTVDELAANTRARSAKLRILQKLS